MKPGTRNGRCVGVEVTKEAIVPIELGAKRSSALPCSDCNSVPSRGQVLPEMKGSLALYDARVVVTETIYS